jgi:hypothetical protein
MALQQSATPLTSHHPLVEQVFNHPTLVTQETISQQPVSIPSRENLRNQLQYVILQEEIKQATLAQQAQLNEAVAVADISCHKIQYTHRHVVKGKGYGLRQRRQPSLTQHLQTVLQQLDIKTHSIERQWLYGLTQGLLVSKPPMQLVESLLMLKLQKNNPTFLQLSNQLFQFAQWLKQQTVAYQSTWEGQRLAEIIQCLKRYA